MKAFDIILTFSIPSIILLHLLIAPYTKVEESFNIQATHDIITYSSLPGNVLKNLRFFDHVDFPGAVPRTFLGALSLAIVSKPIVALAGSEYAQVVVRAVLGLFNAFALLKYKGALAKVYGKDVGRWYLLLQASQFHVMYYASRTLPNMFAFGLTTMALGSFLPTPTPVADQVPKRQKFGILLFVIAGSVFRSEVALLLAIQLLYLLSIPRMSLQQMIPTGLESAAIVLGISIPIDSFFWQKPLWPELWGFYYNAIQGKSAEWGTSPYSSYFSSLLPRLLLNPLIMIALIPLSFLIPALQKKSRDVLIPSFFFIAIYSLQPHKESRFIIYVVPPLTAAAALTASYLWTRRGKSLLYSLGCIILIYSIAVSFAASTLMLLVSSLNYPGGEAITSVRSIIAKTPLLENHNHWEPTYVHMDVLSCMTGVTRFQEIPSYPATAGLRETPMVNGKPTNIVFDKEENQDTLLQPAFWEKFDYALMEVPGKAIGKWEVVDTIYAYAGMEFLRPEQVITSGKHMETVYEANNITKEDGVADSEDVKRAAENLESRATKARFDAGFNSWVNLKSRFQSGDLSRYGVYKFVKDIVRTATGGYWLGPRMLPTIRILRRVKDTTT